VDEEQGGILLARAAAVAPLLETFKEFPPSQRAATFTIDQAMEELRQGLGGH
jgi:arylsulfatase